MQAFSQVPKRGRPILVQRYIYSRGVGVRENVPFILMFTLLHVSICFLVPVPLYILRRGEADLSSIISICRLYILFTC
jgi:hypothetical protein